MRHAGLVVALALCAWPARAQERSALDAPAPPTLPALAHRTLTDTFEVTFATIDPGKGRGRALALLLHDEIEVPLIPRVFYVGAAHDVASGALPGVGREVFFGAPELWVRGLWSSVVGLSSGGGLGVVLPAPRSLSERSLEIFDTVRVVRPWDAPYFTDRVLTLRPWVDVRHLVGRFILQLRQGIDVGVVVRPLSAGERRVDYIGRTTGYIGFRLAAPIGVGLEAWEVYQISADLPDERRAAFALSPSVRFSLGRIEPALSLVIPISTPLRGDATSYFAARLNVGFDFEIRRRDDP